MNTQKIAAIAEAYANYVEWLDACPFPDGQPFYETAQPKLEDMGEQMIQLSMDDYPSLSQAIEDALTDGEWQGEDDEVLFWRAIARRAKEM